MCQDLLIDILGDGPRITLDDKCEIIIIDRLLPVMRHRLIGQFQEKRLLLRVIIVYQRFIQQAAMTVLCGL